MNSPMLSSKLTALETTMCDKMLVITSYFKNEFQLIAIAIDLCTLPRYSPQKNPPKSEHSSVTYEAPKILPFHPTNLLLCQTTLFKY